MKSVKNLSSSYCLFVIYDMDNRGEKYKFYVTDGEFYPFLQSLSVQVSMNYVTQITANLVAPVEEGREMLNNNIFSTKNLVSAKIGYVGENYATPTFTGILSKGPEGLKMGVDGLSGSISAEAQGYPSFDKGYSQRIHRKSDASKYVKKLAEKLGLKVVMTEKAKKNLKDKKLYSNSVFTSPFEELQGILRMVGNDFYFDYQTDKERLMIIDNAEVPDSSYRRKFIFRGSFDPDKMVYPILDYSPENIQFLYVPSAASKRVHTSRINKKGKIEKIESKRKVVNGKNKKEAYGEENRVASTKNVSKKVDIKTEGKRVIASSRRTKTEEKTKLSAQRKDAENKDGLSASITTIGIPDLKPMEYVYLFNIGKKFDGWYQVLQFTHSWSGGNFETTISLLKKKFEAKVKIEG